MAYINILEQPQVNETDSLLGIKDDKVVQIDSKDSCLSGLSNLTEVQKQQVREDINALEDEAGVIDTEHLATGSVTKAKLDSSVRNILTKADQSVVRVTLTEDIFDFTEQTKTFDINVGNIKNGFTYPPIISMSYLGGYYAFTLYPLGYSNNNGFFYYRGSTCYFDNMNALHWRFFDIELYVQFGGEGKLTITESHPNVGRLKLNDSEADFQSSFNSLTTGDNKLFDLDTSNDFNITFEISPFCAGLSSVSVTDSKGVTVVLNRVNSLGTPANYECTTTEGAKFTYGEGENFIFMFKN